MTTRSIHKKLGIAIALWALLWAVSGALLQWQTLSWIPTWSAFKRQKIELADVQVTRGKLLAMGKVGQEILDILPQDIDLRLLNKVELLLDSSNATDRIARIELLGEPRSETLTIDLAGRRVVSRIQSSGPSLLLLLHTGQIAGIPGLWLWLIVALGLGLLTLTGVGIVFKRS